MLEIKKEERWEAVMLAGSRGSPGSFFLVSGRRREDSVSQPIRETDFRNGECIGSPSFPTMCFRWMSPCRRSVKSLKLLNASMK